MTDANSDDLPRLADPRPRDDLQRYETLLQIGAGGMGTVFVGRARGAAGFSRLVALKRPHPHVRSDPSVAKALKREAALASRLHHPNVVRVLDVAEDGGELTLVLDYVEGASLASLVAADPPLGHVEVRTRARAVVRIVLDVAAGLEAVHRTRGDEGRSLGLVHRDVTPSNVLVGEDGVTRLTDFGIATSLGGGAERTETGLLLGKAAYMSPEYLEHGRAEASGDLFSLGVVAWEALAAERLFRSATDFDTARRVLSARIPKLASTSAELAPLDPVIARALERRPDDRYLRVAAFADALEAAARAADLVGSHAEVSECVARVMGSELAERRKRLATTSGEDTDAMKVGDGATARPAGRDDVATARIEQPRPRARTRVAVAGAIALAVVVLGSIVVLGARRGAVRALVIDDPEAPRSASVIASGAPTEVAVSPLEDAAELAPPPLEPLALPSASHASAPSARGARPRAPSAGRRPSPAGSLVPKKAPPNPYLR